LAAVDKCQVQSIREIVTAHAVPTDCFSILAYYCAPHQLISANFALIIKWVYTLNRGEGLSTGVLSFVHKLVGTAGPKVACIAVGLRAQPQEWRGVTQRNCAQLVRTVVIKGAFSWGTTKASIRDSNQQGSVRAGSLGCFN